MGDPFLPVELEILVLRAQDVHLHRHNLLSIIVSNSHGPCSVEHPQVGGRVAETPSPLCRICKAVVAWTLDLKRSLTQALKFCCSQQNVHDAGAGTLFLLQMPCDFQ